MEAKEAIAILQNDIHQELLLRNEYLALENKILRSKLSSRIKLDYREKRLLARKAKMIGKKALEGIPTIVTPDTLFKWYRDLISKKFDTSGKRNKPGAPEISLETEQKVLELAEANPGWGQDRIAGALNNLGYKISDRTVGAILEKHGIPPAPDREPDGSWARFFARHKQVLSATDFFTTEVITPYGLITYYVLFFINIGSRKIHIAGTTPNPDEEWMKQIARNITMPDWGFLDGRRYLIHDGDDKYCKAFRDIIQSVGIKPIRLPRRSPNLNAFAERWVKTVKDECIRKMLFFNVESLLYTLREFTAHYHHERNHQGIDNVIPFPDKRFNPDDSSGAVVCEKRLGGLLNYYYRKAA